VLIDFGTAGLPRRGQPSKHLPKVARHIRDTCEGKLAAVVATHRHADHISGFATDAASGGSGKIIAACKPDVVLQPWTEDPKAARDARTATAGTRVSPKRSWRASRPCTRSRRCSTGSPRLCRRPCQWRPPSSSGSSA